jgi:oxygen-independent coproporphyrinogen-3 oxidase
MAGAMENTGYCKDDNACLYNVRIMDEHQSTLAMGAGGISKKYYPEENRLVRVPNVTNYQEYITRIDEMNEELSRKREEYGYQTYEEYIRELKESGSEIVE